MTAPQTYYIIDIAKFVCALMIVMLHVHVGDMFGGHGCWIVESSLFRLAVPFFFVSSGFFLSKKITRVGDFSYTKAYIIRLLKPLLLWLSINTILEIIKFVIEGKSITAIVITVVRALIFYPYGALWYVYALIIGALILYWTIAKLKLSKVQLLTISVALYIVALLCNNYYWVSEWIGISKIVDVYLLVFKTARNGLFVGFPFIVWGYLLASYKGIFGNNKKTLIGSMLVLISLFIA